MALCTVALPIAHDGLVFQNSGDGSGERDTIAVKLGGKGDVSKTNLVWEDRKTLPYVPTMLVAGDYLFGVNDKGLAFCYEARTGNPVWTERLGSPVTASPILIDGKIYAAAEDGKVYVFAAAEVQAASDQHHRRVRFRHTGCGRQLPLHSGSEHLFCIGKAKK